FDLDKMHVADGLDSGDAHRRFDSVHRLFDLRVAANLLRQKVARMCDADAEALLARSLAEALGARTPREDGDVWRQHALRAARHDERNPRLDLARSELEARRKSITQYGDGIFAGKVVDAAIALDEGSSAPLSMRSMRPEPSPGPC